jgi:hypothetical protein
MRWACLVGGLLLLGGCAQGIELLPLSDAGARLPAIIGEACTESCDNGLICLRVANSGLAFPGGFCTFPCDDSNDCLQGAVCGAVGETDVCLPTCDPSQGLNCRDGGYACCLGTVGPTTDAGACAPSTSEFCG